jgi:hypothetical protein
VTVALAEEVVSDIERPLNVVAVMARITPSAIWTGLQVSRRVTVRATGLKLRDL